MQYPCIWSNLNQRTYSDVESWQPMQLYKDWVGMLHPYMYPSCHHKAWTSAFFDLHPLCFFNRGDGRYLRRCWDVRHFTDSNCFRSFSFMLCCNWEDKTENAEDWFLGMWWFFFPSCQKLFTQAFLLWFSYAVGVFLFIRKSHPEIWIVTISKS